MPSIELSGRSGPHRSFSPADVPPNYGFSEVDWAYLSYKPGEYFDRLTEARDLMIKMSTVPLMERSKVTAETLTQVLSSLYTSFNRTSHPVSSFPALIEHPIAGNKITQLVTAGAFGVLGELPGSTSKIINAPESLLSVDPNVIFFDTKRYQELPTDVKDFLEGLNLLLVPSRYDPNLVSVTLSPRQKNNPIDERYLRFYRELTGLQISSFFSINGPICFPDGYTGVYDRRAVTNHSLPLYPQYETNIKKSLDPEPNLRKLRLDTRTRGDGMQKITFVDSESGVVIDLVQTAAGLVDVRLNGKKTNIGNMPKLMDFFDDQIKNADKYKIQSEIEVDFNLIQKPRSPIYKLGLEEMQTTFYTTEGEIDIETTQTYQQIVDWISTGGYFPFDRTASLINSISDKLTPNQLDFIGLCVHEYALDTLNRGQLKDLEGMEHVFSLLTSSNLSVSPELGSRLRTYIDIVPKQTIIEILMRFGPNDMIAGDHIPASSYWKPDYRTALTTGWDGQANSLEIRPLPVSATGEVLPNVLQKLLSATQLAIPGIEVNKEVLWELRKYGQLLMTMNGDTLAIQERAISFEFGVAITGFLEHIVGRELPNLRKEVEKCRRRKALPASDQAGKDEIDPYYSVFKQLTD